MERIAGRIVICAAAAFRLSKTEKESGRKKESSAVHLHIHGVLPMRPILMRRKEMFRRCPVLTLNFIAHGEVTVVGSPTDMSSKTMSDTPPCVAPPTQMLRETTLTRRIVTLEHGAGPYPRTSYAFMDTPSSPTSIWLSSTTQFTHESGSTPSV